MTTIEDLLARDGYLAYRTRGVSMEPMLRQDRDLVVVRVPERRLRRYDVALYRRGDAHVLHRVIEDKGDHYLIRGDNTYVLESVPDAAVIGVLCGFQRKGREHQVTERGYLLYARIWQGIYPLRAGYVRLRRLAVGAARRMGLVAPLRRLLRKGDAT